MTPQEVAQLLGYASTLDPKISADSALQVRAWANLLEDVPAGIARDAVQDHYRRSSETVMPADIVTYWRQHRRDTAEARHNANLRAHHRRGPLDHRQLCTLRAGVDRVTAALAVARGADPEHAEADAHARRTVLAVACPYCKAHPGTRCTTPSGRPLTRTPAHPSRLDAAAAATATG